MFYKTNKHFKWTNLHWAILTKNYPLVTKLAKKSNIFTENQGINPINLAIFSLDQKLISCLNDDLNSHKFDKSFHKTIMKKLVLLDFEPYLIEFLPVNPEIISEIAQNYANCYNEINGFTPMAKAINNRDVFAIKELVNLGWSEDIDNYIVKKHRGHIKGFKNVIKSDQVRKLIE